MIRRLSGSELETDTWPALSCSTLAQQPSCILQPADGHIEALTELVNLTVVAQELCGEASLVQAGRDGEHEPATVSFRGGGDKVRPTHGDLPSPGARHR